mmetsp:Transcript_29703/g.74271  ORF Transcript_29703/g.74271 Transcript_29703/m.74271 type:complete len:216 (-) Transcript_29703:930-1577(-)
MTRSRPAMSYPYSRLKRTPNAAAKSPSAGLEIMIAVSVPSYRKFRSVSVLHSSLAKPCSMSSATTRASSSAAATAAAALPLAPPAPPVPLSATIPSVPPSTTPGPRVPLSAAQTQTPAKGRCASATTSARPMPYADRIPQKRCTKTVDMPSARAMAQACCGPAPPNAARTCDAVSYPLLSVISLMGRHMASFATRRYPSATSSGVIGAVPVSPSS